MPTALDVFCATPPGVPVPTPAPVPCPGAAALAAVPIAPGIAARLAAAAALVEARAAAYAPALGAGTTSGPWTRFRELLRVFDLMARFATAHVLPASHHAAARMCMASVAHSYFGDAYYANVERIRAELGLLCLRKHNFVEMPRRWGKSVVVAMVVACVLWTLPGAQVNIYSQGGRTSRDMLLSVRRMLLRLGELAGRPVAFDTNSADCLRVKHSDGPAAVLRAYPATVDVRTRPAPRPLAISYFVLPPTTAPPMQRQRAVAPERVAQVRDVRPADRARDARAPARAPRARHLQPHAAAAAHDAHEAAARRRRDVGHERANVVVAREPAREPRDGGNGYVLATLAAQPRARLEPEDGAGRGDHRLMLHAAVELILAAGAVGMAWAAVRHRPGAAVRAALWALTAYGVALLFVRGAAEIVVARELTGGAAETATRWAVAEIVNMRTARALLAELAWVPPCPLPAWFEHKHP
jgi:hypothetical protein